jgi:hypothetical protein
MIYTQNTLYYTPCKVLIRIRTEFEPNVFTTSLSLLPGSDQPPSFRYKFTYQSSWKNALAEAVGLVHVISQCVFRIIIDPVTAKPTVTVA